MLVRLLSAHIRLDYKEQQYLRTSLATRVIAVFEGAFKVLARICRTSLSNPKRVDAAIRLTGACPGCASTLARFQSCT